jgi:hypothetical protein
MGRPEYEGKMTIKASTKKRPLVIDRDKSPITEDDNIVYAGCYVNAIVTLWGQNNQFGKRVNAQLDGVQFVRDGEPLVTAVFLPMRLTLLVTTRNSNRQRCCALRGAFYL